jgi:Cu(I)/Ag(I) efflux system membrane protein CusA/SilA
VIARAVAWCARFHWLVIACALVLGLACELARRTLPRDAVPDLADPQIAVMAEWMGHPAAEVAESVTSPLARALDGIPGSTTVRGSSMAGMAYVDVVFDDAGAIERGRAEIEARLARLKDELPKSARVQVGPLASSTGWVFQYALADPTRSTSLLRMRRLQDTLIRPALLAIPGVAEVASVGGNVSQAVVHVSPDQLRARAVAFSDVVASLRPIAHGEAELSRLRFVPVKDAPAIDGMSPSHVGDLARVGFESDMPTGYADFDGEGAALGGIVVARRGEDPSRLAPRIRQVLDGLRAKLTPGNVPHQKATLEIITAYDRSTLVDRVGQTLLHAIGEEIAVVVLVILVFLLHTRSALVPMATLPFVLLLTFGGMWLFGVPATIMSLGGIGIALGMAVDADVVALEASHRSLERTGAAPSEDERRGAIIRASASFTPAILTSLLVTALSFLPVLAFTGETGRLLRPLAITKTLVILAAAFVAVTLAPALRDRLVRGQIRPELANPLTRSLVRLYDPFVRFALRRPALTLVTAFLAVISCVPVVTKLGGEFLPRLDEGDLLFMPTSAAGLSAGEAAEQLGRQDRAIRRFAEVKTVFGKVGRATTATDPAPLSMAETTIQLRPRSEWPNVPRSRWYSSWAPDWLRPVLSVPWPELGPRTTPELVADLDRATQLPGWTNAWTTPVRARMDMLSTGIRTPVGLRVVAPDVSRLETLGQSVQRIAERVPGARSAVYESLRGEAWPHFEPDRAALAYHRVAPELAKATADLVLSGGELGALTWQGDTFRLRVTHDAHRSGDHRTADPLRDVTVRSASEPSQPVPLALLGRPVFADEPAMLRTERGDLVTIVHVDLAEGVDPRGYVERAARELERAVSAKELALGVGERLEWIGQYELMAEGERTLRFIVPLVLLSMIALLYFQFRSFTEACIVLLSVPFALVGSFWTLYALGYAMSAPVWVGLLSTVGLAMQTGVVMIVYIDEAFHRRVQEGRIRSREDIIDAHAEGTVRRLRPKIMTIATMGAGLVPLLWAQGAGSEILRRVAAPMLGGLVTSALLTLEVLPVIYTLWRSRQLERAQRTGRPLSEIVGAVPGWAQGSQTGRSSIRPRSSPVAPTEHSPGAA